MKVRSGLGERDTGSGEATVREGIGRALGLISGSGSQALQRICCQSLGKAAPLQTSMSSSTIRVMNSWSSIASSGPGIVSQQWFHFAKELYILEHTQSSTRSFIRNALLLLSILFRLLPMKDAYLLTQLKKRDMKQIRGAGKKVMPESQAKVNTSLHSSPSHSSHISYKEYIPCAQGGVNFSPLPTYRMVAWPKLGQSEYPKSPITMVSSKMSICAKQDQLETPIDLC